jgi:uncharacterized membrane protein HdeD (DUF308 family)
VTTTAPPAPAEAPSRRRPDRATVAIAVMLFRALLAYALVGSVLLSGAIRPAIANFIGLYWLVGSILTLRWAIRHRGSRRPLALIAGAFGLIAGVVVLLRNVLLNVVSEDTLLTTLGVAAIAIGTMRMIGAIHDDQLAVDRPRLRHRFLLGVLDVALGVALLVEEPGSPIPVTALTAWAAVGGTLILVDAVALWRARRVQATGEPGS